jgi:calcium-dependent protein kinase
LEKVRENILKGNVDFTPEEIWGGVSDGAKQFIRDLLRVDPSLRPGAAEAQNHPWISSFAAKRGEGTGACCLSAKTVQNLVTFKSYGNMRKLICEIISFTLMAEQIRGLRTEFEMADEEGSGEISLQGLKRILKNSAGSGNMGALTEEEVGAIFENLKMSKVRVTQAHPNMHTFYSSPPPSLLLSSTSRTSTTTSSSLPASPSVRSTTATSSSPSSAWTPSARVT